MPEAQPFDAFQPYYNVMVDWEKRLAHENPFFQRVFASVSARRVLDCACGTGRHLRVFARWGMEVAGSDASPAMIDEAHAYLKAEGVGARLEVADFRELGRHFPEPFDAVICTGNSLPLVATMEGLRQAVRSLFEVLAPGGVAVVHTLNYAVVPEGENVYEGPRVRQTDDREILFLKVFRKVRRLCDLSICVLEKQAGEWRKIETHARAWAAQHAELKSMVETSGFNRIQFFGGYEPKPFDPDTSRDVILVARKEKAAP